MNLAAMEQRSGQLTWLALTLRFSTAWHSQLANCNSEALYRLPNAQSIPGALCGITFTPSGLPPPTGPTPNHTQTMAVNKVSLCTQADLQTNQIANTNKRLCVLLEKSTAPKLKRKGHRFHSGDGAV